MILKLSLLCCVFVLTYAAFEGDKCNVNRAPGTTTLLTKCPPALAMLKKGMQPQIIGFVGTTPLVCCLSSSKADVTTTTKRAPSVTQEPEVNENYYGSRVDGCQDIEPSMTSRPTGQKAFDKCLEYQSKYVYPCMRTVALVGDVGRSRNCHHNADELIVGGNDTKRFEFPHMAMLGFGDIEQSVSWGCGGSIISEKFVLTAAHCTFHIRLGNVKYIAAGAHTRSDANNLSKVYKVKNIFNHPGYASPSHYNDISLLETEKTIALSQYVVPACLHVGDPVKDDQVLATGWGLLSETGSLSDIMQKVILDKFTTDECSELYPPGRNMMDGVRVQSQMCYGGRKKEVDTCKGDSGGPIQIKSKRIHCMYVVVGVTSFGKKCGNIDEPAVYSRVANYVPWIESIVWPQIF